MKTAYFDCIAGASGDMMLGALVDAGLPATELEAELAKLHIKDFHLHVGKVMKNCFAATKVEVHVHDDAPERHLADIRKVVEDSHLSDQVKQTSIRIFTRICEAEAAIHDSTVDKVHLHDLHATLLHLLGLDHERLTFRYGGRDFRLTDVHGRVVHDLIG